MKFRTATLVHQGGETFSAKTGTGRDYVFGDVLAKNEYSPVESILASLASCTAMDVITILEKKRQVVDRYEIEAQALQRTEYPQVLTEIELVHVVSGPMVTEAALRRAIELSATKYCPVNAMLSAGATEIHHRFRIRGAGDEPNVAEGLVVITGPYRRPDIIE
ncbi:MAG TPA: OsmC family protein [Candidatus Limnocylindrales bacterium]|nr:OsmC family protein [Candidatus Limnocylindrales bacterium]